MEDGNLGLRIMHHEDVLHEDHMDNHLIGSLFRERFENQSGQPNGVASVTDAAIANLANGISHGPLDTAQLVQIKDHILAGDYNVQHVVDTTMLAEKGWPGYETLAKVAARLGVS